MAFFSTIPEDTAPTDVKQMYDNSLAAQGYIPNYTKVFSHHFAPLRLWVRFLISDILYRLDARKA
jgi:hypothetical protein